MKAFEISLFFIFLISAANILSDSNFLDSSSCGTANNEPCGTWKVSDTTITHTLNNSLQSQQTDPSSSFEVIAYVKAAISQFGLLFDAVKGILIILAQSTILLPWFLAKLGLPIEVNITITIGVWITYIMGALQFISRTSIYGTE